MVSRSGNDTFDEGLAARSGVDPVDRQLIEELSALIEAAARGDGTTAQPAGRAAASAGHVPSTYLAPMFDDEDLDDPAPPIPSSWRESRDPRAGGIGAQMRAGLRGFTLGLLIVLPAVLYLTGRLDGLPAQVQELARVSETGAVQLLEDPARLTDPRPAASQASSLPPITPRLVSTEPVVLSAPTPDPVAARAPVLVEVTPAPPSASLPAPASAAAEPVGAPPPGVLPHVAAGPVLPVAVAPPVALPPPALPAPVAAAEPVVEQAMRLGQSGDIAGARKLLEAASDGGDGPALFALAETYDPTVLAAWSVRGAAADPDKARELYRRALGAGVERAQGRLQALE